MFDSFVNTSLKAVNGYFRLVHLASLQATILDEAVSYFAQQGPVPPMHLRMRVHGRPDLPSFLQVGFRCASDLESALQQVGKSFQDFEAILDFGCGSGRTLRWLPKFAPDARLCGTDIDQDAIVWLANNLPFVTASVNGPKDRLPYADESFDLIFSISVFTHMDEEHQFFWLEELRRVSRPGGLVIASLHGHDLWKDFPSEAADRLHEEGVFVAKTRLWDGVFPDWYQNTYHSVDYVRETFGRYFELLDYLPLALDSNHDLVLLRRATEAPSLS